MIFSGNPPAITYLEDVKIVNIKLKEPSDNKDLLTMIQEQLAHVTRANVCLSGGLDSQFMLRLATTLNVPVTAYTYLSYWGDSPINTDDYVHAQLSAAKLGIKLETINIDIKEFFNKNLHMDYCKKYKLPSPQIAVHLHFLKMLEDLEGSLFVGGDMPFMCKNSSQQDGPGDISGISASFLLRCNFAYRKLAEEHNIDLVKDVMLYTPEIIYKTLDETIEIVKTHKKHLEIPQGHTQQMHPNEIKNILFERLIPGGINPLNKATGFEKIKKFLATETGIYNQFDLQYRRPMIDMYAQNMKDATTQVEGSIRVTPGNLPKQLSEKFRRTIEENNSVPAMHYSFDF